MYPHEQPQSVPPLHLRPWAYLPFGFFALFPRTPAKKSLLCHHLNSSWGGLYLYGHFTDFKRNYLHAGSKEGEGVESATTAFLGDSCLLWSFTPATKKNRPCLQLLIPFCQLLPSYKSKQALELAATWNKKTARTGEGWMAIWIWTAKDDNT